MKGITIDVGGMVAKVSDDGKSIDISHNDGKELTIKVGPGEIDWAYPSTDGRVILVALTDGMGGPFDTRTGEIFQREGDYNPQFYV